MGRIFFDIFLLLILIFVPLFIYIEQKNQLNQLDLKWLYFTLGSLCCLIQVIFTYNILDNMFPAILFPSETYAVSTKIHVLRVFIFVFYLLFSFFSIFVTILYIINFDFISGNYYLLLIQPSTFMACCFYFLNHAFSDFSGWSYCHFYQSNNNRKIPYHWIPRTLNEEMAKIYENERELIVDW